LVIEKAAVWTNRKIIVKRYHYLEALCQRNVHHAGGQSLHPGMNVDHRIGRINKIKQPRKSCRRFHIPYSLTSSLDTKRIIQDVDLVCA
jgi:hypothetical protein